MISVDNRKFSHPLVICAPAEGFPRFPLEFGTSAWCQKLEWRGYRAKKEILRYLQPSGYNTPTWQTDGQTDTGPQQRPCLHIVLLGKNEHVESRKVRQAKVSFNSFTLRSASLHSSRLLATCWHLWLCNLPSSWALTVCHPCTVSCSLSWVCTVSGRGRFRYGYKYYSFFTPKI